MTSSFWLPLLKTVVPWTVVILWEKGGKLRIRVVTIMLPWGMLEENSATTRQIYGSAVPQELPGRVRSWTASRESLRILGGGMVGSSDGRKRNMNVLGLGNSSQVTLLFSRKLKNVSAVYSI